MDHYLINLLKRSLFLIKLMNNTMTDIMLHRQSREDKDNTKTVLKTAMELIEEITKVLEQLDKLKLS